MSTDLELIDEKQAAAKATRVTTMEIAKPRREANAWMHLHSRIEEINIQVCCLFMFAISSNIDPYLYCALIRTNTLRLLRGSASFGKILASNTKNS